jgi:hypothetical protein
VSIAWQHAKAVAILRSKAKLYIPNEAELEQWFAAAPGAWLRVKGQYDTKAARRLLEEQKQNKLIGLLEKSRHSDCLRRRNRLCLIRSDVFHQPGGSTSNRQAFHRLSFAI